MKKRKTRLGVWSFLIIILAFAAVYFYLTKGDSGFFNNGANGKKESALIYLKQEPNKQSLIKYSLSTQTESIIADDATVGTFVSLILSGQENKSYLLHVVNNKSLVDLLDVKTGTLDLLGDVTQYKPSALYAFKDGTFALFRSSDKHLITVDDQFKKVSEITAENDVTYICSASDGVIKYSVFDGSASTIISKTLNEQPVKGENVTGKIYSFSCEDDNKDILYAKKSNIKEQNTDNPSGNTFWKIALFDPTSGKESILSDGNFDQNAVSNSDYSLFAYQKKYDTNDQEDGRIFIVDTKDKNDRIGVGVPLQFVY